MTQLYGTMAMGSAVEHTVAHVFESAPNPRDLKVIVLMITGKMEKQELEYLREAVIDAKCKGCPVLLSAFACLTVPPQVSLFASA